MLQVSDSVICAALAEFPNLKKVLWSSAQLAKSSESMKKHPFIEMIHIGVCLTTKFCQLSIYSTVLLIIHSLEHIMFH